MAFGLDAYLWFQQVLHRMMEADSPAKMGWFFRCPDRAPSTYPFPVDSCQVSVVRSQASDVWRLVDTWRLSNDQALG